MRNLSGAVLAAAVLALAAVPLGQAQDADNQGNSITISGGRADGRFVDFGLDAEAGALCDWSFEGQVVLRGVSGVGAQARAHGRSVVVDGDADADGSTSAEASASACGSSGGDDGDDSDDSSGDPPSNQSSTGTTSGDGDGDGGGSGGDGCAEESGDEGDGRPRPDDGDDCPARSASPTRDASASARGGAARARVTLHDNPSGAIQLDLRAGQVVALDVDPSLRVRADDGQVRLRGDGLSASLVLAKGGSGVDVDVDGSQILLRADGDAKVHFRVDDADLDDEDGEQFQENRDNDDVACEVFVSDDDRPHVVQVGGGNVTVRSAVHTSVSVNLTLDLDVSIGGSGSGDAGSDGTVTRTQTETRTQTQTRTETRTTTTTADDDEDDDNDDDRDDDDSGGDGTAGEGCGCASRVVIIDVDTTVVILEADDDLLVYLDGRLMAKADSVQDALTIEAGEDPEALVVVDQEQEVKVLVGLAAGSHDLGLQAKDGATFQTREPTQAPPRASARTTTLQGDDGDGGRLPVNEVDVDADRDASGAAADNDQGDPDLSVPGFGTAVTVVAVVAALALLGVRRRLD